MRTKVDFFRQWLTLEKSDSPGSRDAAQALMGLPEETRVTNVAFDRTSDLRSFSKLFVDKGTQQLTCFGIFQDCRLTPRPPKQSHKRSRD